MELVVGTYNLHFILTPKQVEHDLKRLFMEDAGVIGLQEMGQAERVPVLEAVCNKLGWEFFRANDLPAQKQTPIVWDSRVWQAIQTGAHRLNDEVLAEPGAGGPRIESKWAMWVVLEHRHNDTKIAVINWHAPGSVESPSKPKRRKAMAECTRSVRLLARDLKPDVDAVFIVGDMNVNYRNTDVRRTYEFPVMQFRNEGFLPCWQHGRPLTGTHMPYDQSNMGRRLIDYVFSNAQHKRSKILKGYQSDHRPVLVRYKT